MASYRVPDTLPRGDDPNRDAIDFAQLLLVPARGLALWQPSADAGNVGDCGYITGGHFEKFFNVFEPDALFPTPELFRNSDIETSFAPIPKSPLTSSDVRNVELGGDWKRLDHSVTLNNITVHYEAQNLDHKAAFLAFGGAHRKISTYRKTVLFENYLVKYGRQILKKYRRVYPIRLKDIVIVYESTAVVSWFGGISSSQIRELRTSPESSGVATSEITLAPRAPNWVYIRGPNRTSDDEVLQEYYNIIVRGVYAARSRRMGTFSAFRAVRGWLMCTGHA